MLCRQSKSFMLITVTVAVLVLSTLAMLFASNVVDFFLKKRESTKAIENRLVAEMALDTISDWFCAKSSDLISDNDFHSMIPKQEEEAVIEVPKDFFEPILSCYDKKTVTAKITDCHYDDQYAEKARLTGVPQIPPITHEDEIELSFHIYLSVMDDDDNTLNAVRMIKAIKNTVTKGRKTFVTVTYFL